MTPDSSTRCVFCVSALSHISGRSCICPEMSGAIILSNISSTKSSLTTCAPNMSVMGSYFFSSCNLASDSHDTRTDSCRINLNISGLFWFSMQRFRGRWHPHLGSTERAEWKIKRLFCPLVMAVRAVISAPGTVSESAKHQFHQFTGE